MNETKLIAKVLQADSRFEVSLSADLSLKAEGDRYRLKKFGVGDAPNYSLIEESSEIFDTVDNAAEKMVEVRREKKLGFDYERQSLDYD